MVDSALGTRHSALGTRHSALGTRHSAGGLELEGEAGGDDEFLGRLGAAAEAAIVEIGFEVAAEGDVLAEVDAKRDSGDAGDVRGGGIGIGLLPGVRLNLSLPEPIATAVLRANWPAVDDTRIRAGEKAPVSSRPKALPVQ